MELVYNKELPLICNQNYIYKYLVIPDLHLLQIEPNNRNNIMISRQLQLMDELVELIKINKVTGVIFTGDIADRGYKKCGFDYQSLVISKIKNISKAVEGNCFSVFGNHELTYYKDNIFYSVASIDNDVIERQIIGKKVPNLIEPYIKTPSVIDFGDLKIYLVHYDKDKMYKILDESRQAVAIYHDDFISLESSEILYHHSVGNGINILNTNVFNNIDWAIMGHIHIPINQFKINNDRMTVVDTPGSIIPRTITEKHNKVNLPVICIDNYGFHREYLNFNIGDFDETINHEIVKKQQQQYVMSKVIKETKSIVSYDKGFEELLQTVNNDSIKRFIVEADKPIILESDVKYKDFLKISN